MKFTNAEREKENLPALTLSDGLIAGASIRAEEITNLGQTCALNDHARPNGSQWYTVLDGKYNYPGENLDGGAESPAEVLSDWMHSDSHKTGNVVGVQSSELLSATFMLADGSAYRYNHATRNWQTA